jgi:hypothetical protein
MTIPASDGFSVFASLHVKYREERLAQDVHAEPTVLAGRALGIDGPLTLERLICDPELGALTASPPQVALIRAADGKPANDILAPERMLFHFGCERLPQNDNGLIRTGERLPSGRPRLVYLRTGVRAGKTLISVLALLFSVLTCRYRRPPKTELGERPGTDGMVGVRPGELVRAVIVAPKLKLARSPFQHLVGTMQASPRLAKLFAEEPNKESCVIQRPDGRKVLIELVAADAGGAGLRSTWLAGAMFDEADFHDDEEAAVNLKDNIDACRPRMLSGAQILVPSSPWAEGSPFDKMFTEAFKAPLKDDELAFHSDSLSMNPTLDRDEIDKERRKNPENAAREYDATPFGAGAELFYPEDAIRASFTRTEEHNCSGDGNRIEILLPDRRFAHVAGGDLGFRKNSSALAISRSDGGRVRLAFRLELRPAKGKSLKPSEVVREFAFWCMRYGAPAIVGDLHYADTAHEELDKLRRALEDPSKADAEQREWVERAKADPFACSARVPRYIEWDTSQAHTADVHTEMKRRMQEGLIELPADDRMREQCRETRRKAAGGGHVQILLPKKSMSHGDLWGSVVISCTEIDVVKPPPPPPLRARERPDWRTAGRGFR